MPTRAQIVAQRHRQPDATQPIEKPAVAIAVTVVDNEIVVVIDDLARYSPTAPIAPSRSRAVAIGLPRPVLV